MTDQLHEECGVLGIFAQKNSNVASLMYRGLYALQHRGQESCGIVVNRDGILYSHKDLGLLEDVFTQKDLEDLPEGLMGCGHVRYGTTGATIRANCQPLVINHQKGCLAVSHNGNLSNAAELRSELELKGAIFHTTADTETIAYVITQERLNADSIEEAVIHAMNRLDGAYSLVLLSATKLIAVRDPYGFRPLCYGIRGDGTYVIASESCALDAVGATMIRDLLPGEVLVFSEDGITSLRSHCNQKPHHICIFEYIYFARPDSVIEGVSVHEARRRAGAILAQTAPVDADLVIGVPDSGIDAALGYANASGIPYGLGFIKNKYIARTFICPGQTDRMEKVRIKLNPIESVVKDKRIILIDDSIVRGTTSESIVRLLRNAGAREIHMRVSAPPFLNPCYYGTDIDSREHLIACHHSIEEIATIIGADSLAYLPVERLPELIGHNHMCTACFTGSYPTPHPTEMRKDRFQTPLPPKD